MIISESQGVFMLE